MLDRFHKWLDSISVGLPRMPRISRTVCKDGRRGGGGTFIHWNYPPLPINVIILNLHFPRNWDRTMDTIYIYITRRHIFIISIKHVQSVVILNLAMYNCTTKKLFLLVKHCIVDEPKNFEDYYYENIILKEKNEEIHADSQIIIRSRD